MSTISKKDSVIEETLVPVSEPIVEEMIVSQPITLDEVTVILPPKPLIPTISVNQKPGLPINTINPGTGKPWTSKSKPILGIHDDREIVWSPANFSVVDHSTLQGFCKKNKIKIDILLAKVCMSWFEENSTKIEEEAAGYIAAALTVETAQQKLENLQRQIQNTMKALEALKKNETTVEDDSTDEPPTEDEAPEA